MLLNDHPERFSMLYDTQPITAQDTVFCFCGDQVLLRGEAESRRLPVWAELGDHFSRETLLHAFTQGERRCFLLQVPDLGSPVATCHFAPVRLFRDFASREEAYLLMTAYHLNSWYGKHRFCGVCGGMPAPMKNERALLCPQCGAIQYPTIAPAVIVAITHEHKLLLARNAHGAFRHFSLIAGYVEAGETLEQAVKREVQEEVGLQIRDITYFGSQPWGLSQSLMVGFHAKLAGNDSITLQQSELAEANWFTADALPEHAGPASIAYALIQRFKQGELD